MNRSLLRKRLRRGATTVQIAVVIGLIALATIAGARAMGTATDEGLDTTADYFGNPASVTGHWDSQSSDSR